MWCKFSISSHKDNQFIVIRKEPMEFGRVQHIGKINFSLPADAVMTGQVLAQDAGKDPASLRCYVGGTGWGQPN